MTEAERVRVREVMKGLNRVRFTMEDIVSTWAFTLTKIRAFGRF